MFLCLEAREAHVHSWGARVSPPERNRSPQGDPPEFASSVQRVDELTLS